MANRELTNPVETPNALYELLFGIHVLPNLENIEGIDALVVETGGIPRHEDWISILTNHPQTSQIVKMCFEQEIPVYAMDVNPPDSWKTYNPCNEDLDVTSLGIRDFLKEIKKGWEELNSMIQKLLFLITEMTTHSIGLTIEYNSLISKLALEKNKPLEVWRDAICAHKCEMTLAPYLNKELGRKPHFVILYGAGHMGIKDCLEDSARRNRHLSDLYAHGLEGVKPEDLYTISMAMPVKDNGDKRWNLDRIPTEQPFQFEPG